jgi:hypothetical protein
MGRVWIAIAAVLVLAGAGLWFVSSPLGVSVGGVELGGTERDWLRERSIDFLEDLQFKDFKKASTYHLPETQKERDIPAMIRHIFLVRHEQLDIVSYEVREVDLDRSKSRARVRMQVRFRILGDKTVVDNPQSLREIEMILYWFRQQDGSWAMELESSLRP